MIKLNENGYQVICEECNDILEIFDTMEEAEEYQDENMFYIDIDNGDVKNICSSCEDEFVYCDGCNTYHYSCDVNMLRVGYDWYCEESAVDNEYYIYCGSCGDITDIDEACYHEGHSEYYCEYCYPTNSDIIADWHDHKCEEPYFNEIEDEEEPIFYIGTEIEIDGKNINWEKNISTAEHIRENIFDSNEMYYEEDGSLWNGFELITQPMTYNYINENIDKYKQLFNFLNLQGYTGENNKTSGLHIHISRNNITDDMINELIYFLENNLEDILILSRRGLELNHYADSYVFNNMDSYKKHKEIEGDLNREKVLNAFNHNQYDRYKILNVSNRHTIEFRLFKSTINFNHYIGTIDFINTLMYMVINGYLKSWHTVGDIIAYSDSKKLNELWNYSLNKYIELQEKQLENTY